MVHLVYCDNAGKKGEKVLDKILAGKKTMIVRGAAGRKIPHSRVFAGEHLYFLEKGSSEITTTRALRRRPDVSSRRASNSRLPCITRTILF